jgi:hypothetical protein
MLNEDMVYLLNVLDLSNIWKLPIHWDARKSKLIFHSGLKHGYRISICVMIWGFGSLGFLFGSHLIDGEEESIPLFILIFNMLAAVGVVLDLSMERLLYSCGPELVSFFLHIETTKLTLRSRGELLLNKNSAGIKTTYSHDQ